MAGPSSTKTWLEFSRQIAIVMGLITIVNITLYIAFDGGYEGGADADNFVVVLSTIGMLFTVFSLCRPALVSTGANAHPSRETTNAPPSPTPH